MHSRCFKKKLKLRRKSAADPGPEIKSIKISKTLNSSVTALTLGLWRTKPKAEKAATGYRLDLTKVKRGEWQTAEMENLPELAGFSGYFYFDANSKDAYDSAEKIKIKSIKLVPKEK